MQSVGERSSVEGLCTVELVLHRRRIFGSKNGGRRRLRGNAYLYDRYLIAILFAFILHCCFYTFPCCCLSYTITIYTRGFCHVGISTIMMIVHSTFFGLTCIICVLLLFAMECTILVRYLCMTDAFLPCAVIFYSDGNNCCRASEYFTFIDADRYFIIYINICM
jgi:hypothetical protein